MTPFLHIHPSNCFYLLLLFYHGKSDWDEMKSQSSFSLHFSDDLKVLNILKKMCLRHWHFIFWELFV